MKVTQNCVIALTWKLNDTLGHVLDETDDPTEFLLGGQDLLPKIEQVLQDHVSGDLVQLHLEPEDAFGDFDENLIHLAQRTMLPHDLEVGMAVAGSTLPTGCCPDADRETVYWISEIYPDHIVLDGNHPLAGIAIRVTYVFMRCAPPLPTKLSMAHWGLAFLHPSEVCAEVMPDPSSRNHLPPVRWMLQTLKRCGNWPARPGQSPVAPSDPWAAK